mgnify:CR=1 FL=1
MLEKIDNLTDEEVDRELIKIINEEKRVLFKEANSDIKRIKAINTYLFPECCLE